MKQVFVDATPVTPSKIVCVGRNYVEHVQELDNAMPASPVIFLKPNSAITDTLRPATDGDLHYESEICFMVRSGEICGVGFGLDLTRRDLQSELKRQGLPWERAKAFDGSAVFSRFTAFEGALSDLSVELLINGSRVQYGSYAQMIYKPERLLEEIKTFLTLEDGDIIMTGTPEGVGPFARGDDFTGYIRSGDRVLVEGHWRAS